MKISALTGTDNYFEDFEIGKIFKHARGKTITPLENVQITNMVMNTAQGHFNEHMMMATPYKRILSYGGVSFSVVLGLASQDTCENALCEMGLDNIRLKNPVFHGDTLYAYSEVTEKTDSDQEDAGVIRFRHWGVNQNDKVVAELERIVLVKRRTHWAGK